MLPAIDACHAYIMGVMIGTGGMVAAAVLSILAPSDTALTAVRAIDGIFEALVSPLVAVRPSLRSNRSTSGKNCF